MLVEKWVSLMVLSPGRWRLLRAQGGASAKSWPERWPGWGPSIAPRQRTG
jgi:hypothetical protein